MGQHHRNIPFRPPREEKELKTGKFGLYLRFMRAYMWPFRWSIAVCAVVVSIEACSGYLLAYYSRVVVDSILVVNTTAPSSSAAPRAGGAGRVWSGQRGHRMIAKDTQPPARGVGKAIDTGGSVSSSGDGRLRPEAASRRMYSENTLPPANGMGRAIDQVTLISPVPPGANRMLWRMFGFYLATMLLLNYLARVAQRRRIAIGQQVTARLREDMHDKVMQLSMSYHSAHTPGRLLARILSDVGTVQDEMMATILTVISNVMMIAVGIVILCSLEWRMGAIALGVIPIYVVLYKRAQKPMREISKEIRHTNSCLYGLVSQKLDGIKAVQAYGRIVLERLNFHRMTACFLRDTMYQQRLSATLGRAATVVSSLGGGIMFLFGAWRVVQGAMTLGQMMYVYNAAMSLFGPILALSQMNVVVTRLMVVLQRLVEILDEPVRIADAPDAVEAPHPLRYGIELRNVSFTYGPDSDLVIKDVSMTVPAGRWVCLMGASGCGKTTLLYLISRLYEPTSGDILIDGIPLSKIHIATLRDKVAFVPQEAQIFGGTVRSNIVYGRPDATPAQIMAVAKAAEMHDFIMTLPIQYETKTGERGTSLSGGQRQRLSLARALLTEPEVLVLDDCTSALDANTEQKIQSTLADVLRGKTAVIVSQRVSMAMRCHRICVLADGIITESGTHQELLTCGGFYARLHAQQTGGDERDDEAEPGPTDATVLRTSR